MTKYARFEVNGETAYGVVEGDRISQITGSPLGEYEVTDQDHQLSEVRLLAPVTPRKVVAIGLTIAATWETGSLPACRTVPKDGDLRNRQRRPDRHPEGGDRAGGPGPAGGGDEPGDRQTLPEGEPWGGAELRSRLHLRKRCQRPRLAAERPAVVEGEVVRHLLADRAFIVSDLDPRNLRLVCRINGETAQEQSTSDLLHDVPAIIEFVTSVMTLEAGT